MFLSAAIFVCQMQCTYRANPSVGHAAGSYTETLTGRGATEAEARSHAVCEGDEMPSAREADCYQQNRLEPLPIIDGDELLSCADESGFQFQIYYDSGSRMAKIEKDGQPLDSFIVQTDGDDSYQANNGIEFELNANPGHIDYSRGSLKAHDPLRCIRPTPRPPGHFPHWVH